MIGKNKQASRIVDAFLQKGYKIDASEKSNCPSNYGC